MRKELPYCATGSAIKGYNESAIAKRENNDCVVRAFASAFDISYDKAHKYVKEKFGRKDGDGTFGTAITLDKMSKERTQVNHKKIKTMGRKVGYSSFKTLDYEVKVKGQKTVRKMTVGTFTKQNPTGTFFILVKCHAFTIKDGVVIGNQEDAQKLKRVVLHAFQIN
jgi:hypothetical protein